MLGALVVAALLACGGTSRAAVFGEDGRSGGGARTLHRYAAVGLLFFPGSRATAGTATLVARDRILTAAHSLFDEQGQLRQPVEELRFRVGADFAREPYVDFAVTRLVAVGHRSVYDPENEYLDWAVLEVAWHADAPAPVPLLPADASIAWGSDRPRVELAAYHLDVSEGLVRVATACRSLVVEPADSGAHPVLGRPGIIAHDCDAAGMSSGGGLFLYRGGEPHLAAIHVGELAGVGADRLRRADVAGGFFNVALELSPELRAAIASP